MPYLELLTSGRRERIIAISGDTFVIGRDQDCDFEIRDISVSRRHASLSRSDQGWIIEDLSSTNGVSVDGRIVKQAPVDSGMVITIGPVQLRFQTGATQRRTIASFTKIQVTGLMTGQITATQSQPQVRLLLEIAAALDAYESLEQLLTSFGELVLHILRPHRCWLRVFDRDWYGGSHPPQGARTPDMDPQIQDQLGSGQALVLEEPAGLEDGAATVTAAAMGAPIFIAGDVIGFIHTQMPPSTPETKPLEERDLVQLVGVCRLVGAAVAGSKRMLDLRAENQALHAHSGGVPHLIGTSAALQTLRHDIQQHVGPVPSSVLLLGETGTGKSLAARAIHLASPRSQGPFIKVNCASIHRELLESELFGHEKGAFSGATNRRIGQFELASGGTIFLDEIGELDDRSQTKLLAVIQDRTLQRVGGSTSVAIDVRILAATHRDLPVEVEASRFRADLYYRLNVVSLHIPPLRDRREDIRALAEHFLQDACRSVGRRIPSVSTPALEALTRYGWPGNVRQLANCIERAVVFGEDGRPIELQHLPAEVLAQRSASPDDVLDPIARMEREIILEALARCGGNKREVARQLRWSPQKLYRRLKRFDIGEVLSPGVAVSHRR